MVDSKGKRILTALCATALLGGGLSGNVQAVEYVGEVCWKITQKRFTGGPTETFGMRLAATHMGDGHYLLNGHGYDLQDLMPGQPTKGTASITDSGVLMNLDSTGIYLDDEEPRQSEQNGTARVAYLDARTLSGKAYAREVGVTAAETVYVKLFDGSMELIACPN